MNSYADAYGDHAEDARRKAADNGEPTWVDYRGRHFCMACDAEVDESGECLRDACEGELAALVGEEADREAWLDAADQERHDDANRDDDEVGT